MNLEVASVNWWKIITLINPKNSSLRNYRKILAALKSDSKRSPTLTPSISTISTCKPLLRAVPATQNLKKNLVCNSNSNSISYSSYSNSNSSSEEVSYNGRVRVVNFHEGSILGILITITITMGHLMLLLTEMVSTRISKKTISNNSIKVTWDFIILIPQIIHKPIITHIKWIRIKCLTKFLKSHWMSQEDQVMLSSRPIMELVIPSIHFWMEEVQK